MVTGVTAGLIATRAHGEPKLATITPAHLLENMVEHAGDVTTVSGDMSWKNDVLGLSMLSFGGQSSGDLTALLGNGSGRVWIQDGKVRFDIQGAAGDTIIVGDSAGVWVYTYASNTATEYTFPARSKTGDSQGSGAQGSEGTGAAQSSQKAVTEPVAAIEGFIQQLAPHATLAVSDQVTVAGRDCYVLSMIPMAPNTVFGSVRVAVDGDTYLPLKLDLYAKGVAEPVLTAGFTSVSYSKVGENVFAFTPPTSATVERKTLTLPGMVAGGSGGGPAAAPHAGPGITDGPTPLTLAEAAIKAGFAPPAAQIVDPALAFAGAWVIPAEEVDLQSLLDRLSSGMLGSGMPGSSALRSDEPGPERGAEPSTSTSGVKRQPAPLSPTPGPVTVGPTVIQRYGQGFGTIVLVETRVPTELATQLQQLLAGFPLVGRTDASGVAIYRLDTALGSVALWNRDGLLFVAGGFVSRADLERFIAGVR
ncbi:MAG: hypothetical protein ABH877_02990 [bacterium]